MPQSLAQIYMHLIFSTKDRHPFLKPETHEPLRAYFGGILRNLKCPCVLAGSVSDHVHLLYSHSRNLSPADLVEEIKKETSKWMKTRGPAYRQFYWQRGYGMFSVSASRLAAVTKYIQRQEIHHRKTTFQDEYRRFLREYGIAFDERYVWD